MHRCRRSLLALAVLSIALPFRAPADATAPESGAEQSEAAIDSASHATTGKIEQIRKDSIVVRRMGQATQVDAPPMMAIFGGPEVLVSGQGKTSWSALGRGDLVAVSYRLAPNARAVKVLVLPVTAHPLVAATVGVTPAKTTGRVFTGWIKYKDLSLLVVRTADRLPPHQRPGQARMFVRHADTRVELHRSSWDDLKKGDRVVIHFQKGNPRPADLVKVVQRGGEKPLPPGLATRLFDPEYDTNVKDVDGIGEIPPGQKWTPPPPRSSPSASN